VAAPTRDATDAFLEQAIATARSDETIGHGTHTKAKMWKEHLARLLRETEKN